MIENGHDHSWGGALFVRLTAKPWKLFAISYIRGEMLTNVKN